MISALALDAMPSPPNSTSALRSLRHHARKRRCRSISRARCFATKGSACASPAKSRRIGRPSWTTRSACLRTQALPALVFDPEYFIQTLANGRPVFRPERETLLLHLAHPIFQQTFATFRRLRFSDTAKNRWLVRRGGVPAGTDAVVLLTIEELAVNDLRETFHHWVRTLALPGRKRAALGKPLPHRSAAEWSASVTGAAADSDTVAVCDWWPDIEDDVKKVPHRLAAQPRHPAEIHARKPARRRHCRGDGTLQFPAG